MKEMTFFFFFCYYLIYWSPHFILADIIKVDLQTLNQSHIIFKFGFHSVFFNFLNSINLDIKISKYNLNELYKHVPISFFL
jgi:hypothetical protein